MQYVKGSLKYRQFGWVGDAPCHLAPHTYSDADFVGCNRTLRSTSGAQLNLEGPNTCFPIAALSRRQTCVSFSTPEAEIVALCLAFRTFTLPAISLWDVLLPGGYKSVFHEDNSACISVIKSGKKPTMRYLDRTHGISLQFLLDHMGKSVPNTNKMMYDLKYTDTKRMVADIHTKGFTCSEKWHHATQLCNVFPFEDFSYVVSTHAKWFGHVGKIDVMPGDKTDECVNDNQPYTHTGSQLENATVSFSPTLFAASCITIKDMAGNKNDGTSNFDRWAGNIAPNYVRPAPPVKAIPSYPPSSPTTFLAPPMYAGAGNTSVAAPVTTEVPVAAPKAPGGDVVGHWYK